jgi:CheY-like chemotaxis protein
MDLIMTIEKGKLAAGLPVIITTTDLSTAAERQCIQAGVLACIRGPVHAKELYRSVQAAIEITPRKTIRIPSHLLVSVNNVQLDSVEGE